MTTLGSVADFVMGQAPPGSASNFDGLGTVFVKAGEFGSERPVVREWTTQPLKFACEGDVLICVVGATAGKLNLGMDCAIGRSVAAIRPRPGVDQRFVYLQLLPKVLELRAGSAGSAQGVISSKDLAEVPFVLAPLAEQRRIVAALEEHLSALDAAVAGLRRALVNIERFRTSSVDQAVSGRAEPGWPRVLAGELCEWASGDYLPQKLFSDGVVPVYGGNGISGTHAFANVHESTVIVGRVGANCGNAYLSSGPVWVTDNAIFAKRVSDMVSLPFLTLVMNAARLNMRATGSGQPFVNQRMLNETQFVLPPMSVQNDIVEQTDRATSLADRLAADVEIQLARAARLRQSILQRAFAGALVPPDPADAPASIAPEPDRTERSSAPASSRPARGRGRTARTWSRRG
ncbi:MAG: restriction endonuclease subunit S [Gemmatimonadaceae bacterium]|nr:restriction endonuclease subunit S [Gemmatimonadaceae bacterium]